MCLYSGVYGFIPLPLLLQRHNARIISIENIVKLLVYQQYSYTVLHLPIAKCTDIVIFVVVRDHILRLCAYLTPFILKSASFISVKSICCGVPEIIAISTCIRGINCQQVKTQNFVLSANILGSSTNHYQGKKRNHWSKLVWVVCSGV